jgi:hypothetical protein
MDALPGAATVRSSRPRFPFLLGYVSIAVTCFLSGCGTVKITLVADEKTNQGRPLQVVVCSVDEQAYRAESYSAVSRLVTAPDASVLRRLVLDPQPKLRRTFRIKPPSSRPVALYLLYTAPTGNWKMLLLPPLPYSVTVPLRRGGIAVEQVSERRFRAPDSVPPNPSVSSGGAGATPSVPSAPSLPGPPSLPAIPSPPPAPSIPSAPGLPGPPSVPSPPPIPTAPAPSAAPGCPCPPVSLAPQA